MIVQPVSATVRPSSSASTARPRAGAGPDDRASAGHGASVPERGRRPPHPEPGPAAGRSTGRDAADEGARSAPGASATASRQSGRLKASVISSTGSSAIDARRSRSRVSPVKTCISPECCQTVSVRAGVRVAQHGAGQRRPGRAPGRCRRRRSPRRRPGAASRRWPARRSATGWNARSPSSGISASSVRIAVRAGTCSSSRSTGPVPSRKYGCQPQPYGARPVADVAPGDLQGQPARASPCSSTSRSTANG